MLQQSIDRVQAADAAKVHALVAVLRQGVAGRHLQLFGNDERVQAVSEGFGADGMMRPRDGRDFVAVVDAIGRPRRVAHPGRLTYGCIPNDVRQKPRTCVA